MNFDLSIIPLYEKKEILDQLNECIKFVDEKYSFDGVYVWSYLKEYQEKIFYAILEHMGVTVDNFIDALNNKYLRDYENHDNEITIDFKGGYYRTIDNNCIELLKEFIKGFENEK